MKNTFKYIISTAVLLAGAFAFAPAAFADGEDEINVRYDKTVDGPDANGVYTLSLEAYVTGSLVVTNETAPADIVLVLDYSSSMNNDVNGNSTSTSANQRINILRGAVKDFVDIVKNSNAEVVADALGKHRLAFVLYGGGDVFTGTGLNTLLDVDDLTTTAASGSGNSYTPATVTYGTSSLLSSGTERGNTNSDTAMQKAEEILSGVRYPSDNKRSRVVVFFTDGAPGSGQSESNWQNSADRLTTANNCINYANNIKTSETYGATVYAVGMFPAKSGADATTTYLAYTSSDYTGKTAMPNASDYVNVSNDKSIIVSSAGALTNVFSSIAESTGGNYDAASSSSVLVDIVAQSFSIPAGTDLGSVKVYKDTCTQASRTAIISFANDLEDITSQVTLVTDKDKGEVSVSGFDYGANWCGWDDSANNGAGGPHGNRLVLQIPIVVNEEAVGGPAVETNADGSQLILINADGDTLKTYDFPKPTLKIPVSIWIEKHGLVDDDSAVFTLARAPYYPGATYANYTDTTVVYYVDEYDTEGIKLANTWENFTKVIINEKNMQTVIVDGVEHKVVKLSGLDPDYYYRIKEDAWAWGYQYQDGGIEYTIGDNLSNPIQVYNVPDPDAPKHAEAVVRNVFTERTTSWTTTVE